MAIGSHELLLIVRAQNQASALLGRVGNDFRRLQNMKNLDVQRSQQINRMSRNALQQQTQMAKIQSVITATGKDNLRNAQALDSIYRRQENIANRINALEIRRSAVARAEVNLEIKRMRIQQQELSIETDLEKIELRRQTLNNQIGRIGTSILRNQVQGQALDRQKYALETTLMQRQLAQQKAISKEMSLVSRGVGGSQLAEARTQSEIARRRVEETTMAIKEVPGRRGVLTSARGDLTANIARTQTQIEGLKAAEQEAADKAAFHAKRIEELNFQMSGLAARAEAANAAERELRAALEATSVDLKIQNAEWEKQTAAADAAAISLQHLTAEQKVYNDQLKQTDALIAAQGGERFRTYAQSVSHLGRVLSATGLIGVAALGAMAVSAAHFNEETTRASTQTGNIFTANAQTIAAGADKIGKSVTDIMQTIPASSHDLTDSFYYIYSTLNTTLGQGTKLVKLFAQAWLAGGMVGSVQDVSKALVTLGNNWGIAATSGEDFRKLVASSIATVRFGGLSLEQYTQTMNQLAPAFKGAHQSIEEMNGAIAFLTRLMPSTGQAATGIARLVQQMQRLAARPAPGFEQLAKDIQDANGNLLPFSQVMQIIIREHPEIVKSGVALTNFWKNATGNQGTQMAYKAFQAFVQHFGDYQHILSQTSGDQKDFNRDLQAMEKSTGVRWDVFVSQMKALGLELGTAVVPFLLAAAKPLQNLAHWFNSLSDAQKKSVGQWAAYIAAGVLAVGVFASLVGGLALFANSLKTVGTAMGILKKEAGLTNPQFAIMLVSLTLLITILAHFHVHLLDVITGTNGLTGALKLLAIAITAITFGSLIRKLAVLGLGMDAAAASAGRLRGALVLLSKMSLGEAIVAGVAGYGLSRAIDATGLGKNQEEIGGHIYNALNRTKPDVDVQVKNLQKIRDDIRKKAAEGGTPWNLWDFVTGGPGKAHFMPDQAVFEHDLQGVQRLLNTWMGNRMVRTHITQEGKEAIIQNLMPELDTNTIDIMLKMAAARYKRAHTELSQLAGTGYAAREGIPTGVATRSAATQFTTPEYLAAIRRAYALQQAYQKAPDLRAARSALLAFNNYVAKITAGMTASQKKMFQELLGLMGQFTTIGNKPLEQVIKASQAVDALQKAAEAAPHDLSKWKAFFAAQAELTKKYSSDQISQAQQVISAYQNAPATRVDPGAVAAAEHVSMLEKAAEAAPHDLSKWNAFFAAQAALSQRYSSAQVALAQQVISAWENSAPVATHTQRQIDAMVDAIDRLQKIAAKHPTMEIFIRIAAMQDALSKAATGNQQSIGENLLSARQALEDKRTQIAKEAADKRVQIADTEYQKELQIQQQAEQDIKSATQTILGVYTTALQQYQSQLGTIFQGPFMQSAFMQARNQFGFSARPQDLLKDMNESVSHFEHFQNSIAKLRARGAPEELIKQIQALGPEAQKQLDEVLQMSPSQFKKWIDIFNRGQAEAQKLAKADMDRQLKEWLKFGKNVALAIMTGIKSQTPAMEDAITAMIKKIFPGLAAKAATTPVRGGGGGGGGGSGSGGGGTGGGGGGFGGSDGSGDGAPGGGPGPLPLPPYPQAVAGMLRGANFNLQTSKFAKMWNEGGQSYAAVSTALYKTGKNFALIPAIVNGVQLTTKQAIARFKKTGEEYGEFSSKAAATKYAIKFRKYWSTFFAEYIEESLLPMSPLTPDLGLGPKNTRRVRNTGRSLQNATVVHNVTYNVHPTHQGEGLETMLRRSHFYYRNRKTNL